MVYVRGGATSAIPATVQLGLSADPIQITLEYKHLDVTVNAWSPERFAAEIQTFQANASVGMTLVHFDRSVLSACVTESLGGNSATQGEGTMARAGTRMGGNVAQFAAGNHFIGLQIASPVGQLPWRFWYAYLSEPPMEFPLGTERSLVKLRWKAITFTNDPWGGGSAQPGTVAGTGSQGAVLFDHVNSLF